MSRKSLLVSLAMLVVIGTTTGLFAAGEYYRTDVFQLVNGFVLGEAKLSGMSTPSTGVVQVGGADVTTVNIVTSTGTAALPPGFRQNLVICGDDAGGTTTNYLGPSLPAWKGDGSDASLASTACSALDSTTEATADLVVSSLAMAATGMRCISDSTQAAGESLVMTLRSAAADTTPVISCTIGEAATECRTNAGTTTNIAAGATLAVKVVPTGNNAAGHVWCTVSMTMP